jgi:NADPH-dependent curcumin reductase CurA
VLKNYLTLIMNRLHLIGFTMMDYLDRMDEATSALTKAIEEGKLKIDGAETIVDVKGNIEDIPKVWVGLFEGTNKGKLVTKI